MISTTAWIVTIAAIAFLIAFDFFLAYKDRHKTTSLAKAALWVTLYVGIAIAFGISLGFWATHQARTEFFAGWITEYSLSFDNLFLFILIISRMKIAREKQELVLLIGIVSSLFLRGIFIAAGSALVESFHGVFFFFGIFLIYTAVKLFGESEKEEWKEGRAILFLKNRGASAFVLTLVAISLTNVLFAFDSIPAIFGLTKSTYIIITANVFALMGLRQLYFLLGGLIQRLIYLTKGLSIILAFIGVKLILEAAVATHHQRVWGVTLPEISLQLSLGVIIGTLILTAILSLFMSRGREDGPGAGIQDGKSEAH